MPSDIGPARPGDFAHADFARASGRAGQIILCGEDEGEDRAVEC